MKRLFIFGLLALALGATAPAFAKRSQNDTLADSVKISVMRNSLFYKALDAAAVHADAPEVLKTLEDGLASKDQGERANAVQWLMDNTFAPQDNQTTFNAFYFMFLSDIKAKDAVTGQQLGKVDDSKAAALIAVRALMAFEILANADAERCGDPTVTDAIHGLVTPKYFDLKFAFKTVVDKETYDKDAFEAIDIEGRKSNRPLNVAVCMLGQMASSNAGYKPPVETPDDLKTWGQKRAGLRNLYKTTWSDRYYKLTDAK